MNDNMMVTIKAMGSGVAQRFERTVSMNMCLKFSRIIYDDECYIDYTFKNLTGEQVGELVEYIIKDFCNLDYMEITIQ